MEQTVEKMEVGQRWRNLDCRQSSQVKTVVAVKGSFATLKDVATGRESKVKCKLFLARQGTASGYELIR